MSRIGAKASRARKEAKIRNVVQLAIAEGLIEPKKPDPVLEPHDVWRKRLEAERAQTQEDTATIVARLFVAFVTVGLFLEAVYFVYSFLNP